MSCRKTLVALFCALALSPAALAQPEVEEALAGIRPEAIRAHMLFLADDLLEGRGTGSRGYELAAKYVASRFEALGLEPAGSGGSYFQPVPLLRAKLTESEGSLALVRDGERTELKYGEDFLLDPFTPEPESSVTAPVAFVGFGITAPELGYDDYAGIDVRGKIVVQLSGAPASFPHNHRAYYSTSQVKQMNAVSRGAVGVLAVLTPEDERRAPWQDMVRASKAASFRWVDGTGKPPDLRPEWRGSALLSRKSAETLFTRAPRPLAEVFETATAGKPQSFDLPVQASLRTVGTRERAESPNVAAVLRGSDPKLRDEYVVLTAHLDHMGIGEPIEGDSIYNGAYDNASGIAALLEVAGAFASLPQRPRRSVLFLAVAAEEQGLQGSDYFARHPTVPIGKIVANVNVDMFMMFAPLHDVVGFGAEHTSLGQTAEQAARRLGVEISPDPFPQEVIFVRSDQYSFVKQGIPSLLLTTGFQSEDPDGGGPLFLKWLRTHYHKPSDDLSQTFDFEAGAKFTRLNFLIALQVAQEVAPPRWNEGDFFGGKFSRKPEL
ncbi:MAG TPA: M28 family metallopeptidase [Thermoanaerobaculia bacterium]|nr:M28 family metallopeptidase [Thermoanaerobaculia bacterium]